MRTLIDSYRHRTGEHCASTALRNILHYYGLPMSEPLIFGLASGLGFFYIAFPETSPTHMFHGRTLSLEEDFGPNTGIPMEDRPEEDDETAWRAVQEKVAAGDPVMISSDPYYLGYHRTTSHFPGHRAVVVGYDDAARAVFLADRKFEALQTCSFDELRRSRNADDYAMSCHNKYSDFSGPVKLGVSLEAAIRAAMRRNCLAMLTPETETMVGIGGMRALAAGFADWQHIEDWSWAARFGYQVVIKRGAGGSFFRSLYAGFLEEAGERIPALAEAEMAQAMTAIAARWRDLAWILKEQSELEQCAPELFIRAGTAMAELADAEESFFTRLLRIVEAPEAWPAEATG